MRKLMSVSVSAMAVLAMAVPAQAAETERPNITAYKASGITIDGSLDEWNLDSPAVVKDPTQLIRDAVFWQGENDCSANYYLAWDEENLYMAADVTEDTPLGAIEMLPIDGEDNLKLYISTDPSADPARTEYGTNDFLVYFVMDEGYWEAVIPWACFSNDKIPVYTPQAGDTLSCNFAITDISYPCPGTEYIPQMAWSGTLNINTNPSEWGSVTLAE